MADCDSDSLTRVKPASSATNYSRREREVEEKAAAMSVRASPPSESRGDDGDRDAKAFPHAHIEGVEFAKFPKMPSWLSNCWGLFFLILSNLRCQPHLANSWRCSNSGMRSCSEE